ncbi:L-amino acid N-acyltransferase YncA [Bacillus oleivorans]|uniref:L-amino acid N-acyltransferase YncA n=1 Tax=Bacillus oleivorans TaxID=1448271 RepID=A0A285CSR7_9BACI|nr:GNAT family N-acetyltransferase [Bacillus oleivorans]SNX70591.1 L-amino acid N-acyltransferase YncA [Bacillus oleivorans]
MDKKNKFIGKFVNEMYAILLGIGISNIIFVQKIDLKNFNETVMALFVISVALIYWWDWSEHVESDVKTTKREFFIDFLILLNLEMLFAYFNDLHSLAFAFIVLGILDFFWVLNFQYEAKRAGTFQKNRAKVWLLEKVLVILIYGFSWALIQFTLVSNYTILQMVCIISSFILVRNFGFNNVKDSREYTFEKATYYDIEEIVDINNSYFNGRVIEGGFLLKKLVPNDVRQAIDYQEDLYFVAKDSNGKVIGYIELKSQFPAEVMDGLEWESPFDLQQEQFYIEQVAVHQEYQRKGVGSFLYDQTFRTFPEKNFSAFVVSQPIRNESSIRFHQKMGFEQKATFHSNQYAGMSPYESILFMKPSLIDEDRSIAI